MKMKYLVPEIHVLAMDDTDKFGIGDSNGDNASALSENSEADKQAAGFQLPVL